MRFIAALLLTILCNVVLAKAITTGGIRTSPFARSIVARQVDSLSFWFFSACWGLLGAFCTVGLVAVAYQTLVGTAPTSSTTVFSFQPADWPLGVVSLGFVYLIVGAPRRDSATNRGGEP